MATIDIQGTLRKSWWLQSISRIAFSYPVRRIIRSKFAHETSSQPKLTLKRMVSTSKWLSLMSRILLVKTREKAIFDQSKH